MCLPPSRDGGEAASCHSPAHFLHTHISDRDLFMTACCLLLHITPRSLHNFCSWTLFWRNPGSRGVKGRSVAHAMHPKPQLQYLENVDLDAKRVFGALTRAPARASFWCRSPGNDETGGGLYDRILKMPTYFNKCLTVLYLHYNEAMQLLFLSFFTV